MKRDTKSIKHRHLVKKLQFHRWKPTSSSSTFSITFDFSWITSNFGHWSILMLISAEQDLEISLHLQITLKIVIYLFPQHIIQITILPVATNDYFIEKEGTGICTCANLDEGLSSQKELTLSHSSNTFFCQPENTNNRFMWKITFDWPISFSSDHE